jgi:hypothetical protein
MSGVVHVYAAAGEGGEVLVGRGGAPTDARAARYGDRYARNLARPRDIQGPQDNGARELTPVTATASSPPHDLMRDQGGGLSSLFPSEPHVPRHFQRPIDQTLPALTPPQPADAPSPSKLPGLEYRGIYHFLFTASLGPSAIYWLSRLLMRYPRASCPVPKDGSHGRHDAHD